MSRPVLDLERVPTLRTSLATGLARSARAAAAPRVAGPLPDLALRAHGLTADPGRLSDYQHLLGLTAADALPAGFVHVLAFPLATALMVRPDFPLPLLGLVHLANEVTQLRPVALGEELTVTVQAQRLAAHHRGVSVDLVARAAVGDEPVWQGTSTYLAKGYRLPGADAPPRAERPDWHPPTPTGAWRLGADLGRRYAAVSGDHNPIHTSALAAKAFGFPRAIAHGMYTAARALALTRPGPAFTWSVQFHTPIALPATVSVAARPAPPTQSPPATQVDVWSRRPHLTAVIMDSPPTPAPTLGRDHGLDAHPWV